MIKTWALMMGKLTLAILALLTLVQSNVSLAEEPHIVLTPDCPAGQTCCPLEIYCSYDEGCGDTDSWTVNGQSQSFEGVKQFSLYKISAWLSSHADNTYYYHCLYGTGERSGLDIISLAEEIDDTHSIYSYKLNGNWEYSGFIKKNATCSSNNPLDCTATQVSQAKARLAPSNPHETVTN